MPFHLISFKLNFIYDSKILKFVAFFGKNISKKLFEMVRKTHLQIAKYLILRKTMIEDKYPFKKIDKKQVFRLKQKGPSYDWVLRVILDYWAISWTKF